MDDQPQYAVSPSHCAVCDHHFNHHKDGGECIVKVNHRWCDCHSYCSPRPISNLT